MTRSSWAKKCWNVRSAFREIATSASASSRIRRRNPPPTPIWRPRRSPTMGPRKTLCPRLRRLPANDLGHALRQFLWRTNENVHPHFAQLAGGRLIVRWPGVVPQSPQSDHADPAVRHQPRLSHQIAFRPPFEEIRDEHHDGSLRLSNQPVRVHQPLRDVRAAAQLNRQQYIHRLTDLIGEIDDLRI